MKQFIQWMDNCPFILKLIFAIPVLDVIWVIYRLCRSLAKNNIIGIILGIILLVVGIPFLWLIDIISLIVANKVIWVD